jgi:hypothetical protein
MTALVVGRSAGQRPRGRSPDGRCALDPAPLGSVGAAARPAPAKARHSTGFLSEVRQPFFCQLWIQRVMPSRT